MKQLKRKHCAMNLFERLSLTICSFCFCFFCSLPVTAQKLSDRIANYSMDVTLDVDQKMLSGQTRLHWQNPSTDTVHELRFHMYYNAFKNSRSTFMIERGGPGFLTSSWDDDCGWSWTAIDAIGDGEHDFTPHIFYTQPDDDNVDDQTVLVVPLTEPVLPQENITIDFSWTAKIPKSMARTGYNKDYYFFAQWFPKLGVYEPAGMRFAKSGGWNCHQYHARGEYYADFGAYDVRITLPEDFCGRRIRSTH